MPVTTVPETVTPVKKAEATPVRLPGGTKRVRISPGGGLQTFEFKGRVFSRGGAIYTADDLGWTNDDVTEARKDPHLVIEPIADEK